jgi:acetyl-CoA C-acetyltransferase
MKRKGLKYGVASLCIGGGMGAAVILRNTDID